MTKQPEAVKQSPEITLDTYRSHKLQCKEEEKLYRALEPEVKEILRKGFQYEFLKLVEKKGSTTVDPALAEAWCKEVCSKKELEALYTRFFDVNKFADLLKVLPKEIKKKMPLDIIKQGKPSTEVHLVTPKE
jgi:hypothetical protein